MGGGRVPPPCSSRTVYTLRGILPYWHLARCTAEPLVVGPRAGLESLLGWGGDYVESLRLAPLTLSMPCEVYFPHVGGPPRWGTPTLGDLFVYVHERG